LACRRGQDAGTRAQATTGQRATPTPDGDVRNTHEQILHLLSSSTGLRKRSIILLLASTGMRIGALSAMTIGALSKVNVKGYKDYLYKIIVYEGEREQYYCSAVLNVLKS
jgi:hypothetical protein